MPIKFDPAKENTWHGVAMNNNNVFISVGPMDAIRDIYSVDYEKRTATKVLSFDSTPTNFTITPNGKYLITVGTKKPQVALYDLATYKLLSTQDSVSLQPSILFAN